MIRVEKVLGMSNYICSFCGTGIGTYAIKYEDPVREAVVPVCQVCYEALSQACAKNDYEELTEQVTAPAPKKSTRKKKVSE